MQGNVGKLTAPLCHFSKHPEARELKSLPVFLEAVIRQQNRSPLAAWDESRLWQAKAVWSRQQQILAC